MGINTIIDDNKNYPSRENANQVGWKKLTYLPILFLVGNTPYCKMNDLVNLLLPEIRETIRRMI